MMTWSQLSWGVITSEKAYLNLSTYMTSSDTNPLLNSSNYRTQFALIERQMSSIIMLSATTSFQIRNRRISKPPARMDRRQSCPRKRRNRMSCNNSISVCSTWGEALECRSASRAWSSNRSQKRQSSRQTPNCNFQPSATLKSKRRMPR